MAQASCPKCSAHFPAFRDGKCSKCGYPRNTDDLIDLHEALGVVTAGDQAIPKIAPDYASSVGNNPPSPIMIVSWDTAKNAIFYQRGGQRMLRVSFPGVTFHACDVIFREATAEEIGAKNALLQQNQGVSECS